MSKKYASREDAKTRRNVEEIAAIVVDTALQLHRTNFTSSPLRMHQQEDDNV